MKILDVINVGQGDSMVIRPPECCHYRNNDIFVDLGPGGVNVAKHIRPDHNVSIFITHHDSDHLNGIRYFINNFDNISELILPFYQNEITLIAQIILNLKGFATAKNCSHFKRLFNDIIYNQNYLRYNYWNQRTHLRFAYEGMHYCDHIEVLNPPITPQCSDWLNSIPVDEYESLFNTLFNENFAQSLLTYVKYSKEGYQYDDPISSKFIRIQDENFNRNTQQQKVNVVLDFIKQSTNLFTSFNATPTQTNMNRIYKNYLAYTHDYCIVLKLKYEDKTFLLTADASKKVFNRLIAQDASILKSDYLKMPHHGSKNNMNGKILNAINPTVAIISHDNGLFGRATDPHPNTEVIDLLKKRNIKILITNDVIKNNSIKISKSQNVSDNYVEIIG